MLRYKVALVGCGTIGTMIAKAIDAGEAGEVKLAWLFDIRSESCESLAKKLRSKPKLAKSIEEILADKSIDLVIEAASQTADVQYALDGLR